MLLDERVLALAKRLWDYHHLGHSLEKSGLIFVLGSHDERVAERAVELYREGWAPRLLFTGKRGALTQDWEKTEAERFAEMALKAGVPEDRVLVEPQAVNTGENIRFGYRLLAEKDLIPRKMILVQKPYMERRTWATFMKQWPEVGTKVFVTSPRVSFENYPTEEITMGKVIHIMVGDLVRIRDYPAKGFQIKQEIPEDVWKACMDLIKLGYTAHLPPE